MPPSLLEFLLTFLGVGMDIVWNYIRASCLGFAEKSH